MSSAHYPEATAEESDVYTENPMSSSDKDDKSTAGECQCVLTVEAYHCTRTHSYKAAYDLVQLRRLTPSSYNRQQLTLTDQDIHTIMDLEVQLEKEVFETSLIEHIDAYGHLITNNGYDVEIEKTKGMDLEFAVEKEVTNELIRQVFDTPDDAYEFYNSFAFLHGFGIQGFKDLKRDGSEGNAKKRRRALRTGCEAFLRISIGNDGKWSIDEFSNAHNHELTVTPTKVMKHRSHGKFHRSMACKSLMLELGQSGLRPCQIKKVVNTMKNPSENDVTSKQCADILGEQRKQYKGEEFYGLIKHFQDKLIEDPNLYFVVDLFEDRSPKYIFWVDGRSRDSYIKFADVVVFDVTYMTNKFMMPFAPFVGVNHHRQSILFAGALLENEKQETFEWLFQNFLKCMFDKHPLAIITDQDKAIGNAIKRIFPKTRHRFCSWHIKKHQIEHLRSLIVRYSDIEDINLNGSKYSNHISSIKH
ncbi:protein FAR1-RELATED SEQUENCE 5-like [Bidens hawaiensis]|uniref:protein FAR1-RELATED SEQUENCE 5-like n=1 Tax=Bidens hawaiensis TaxID=980011 RepID=UPI00404AEE63